MPKPASDPSVAGAGAILILALMGGAACAHAPAGRFLYQVSCSGHLDRFDTVAGRKTDSFDLSQRTGPRPLIPRVDGALETCLTSQATFDPVASVFYTLVPSQAQSREDGTVDYRVLGFSVPGISLVKQLNAGERLDRPPHIELTIGSEPRVIASSAWIPRTSLDLSGFAPDRTGVPNRIIEMSGKVALIQILAGDRLILGVADMASRTLVRLTGSLASGIDYVHLAPGGRHVLVEELTGSGGSARKTGRLWLYDGISGAILKTVSDPRIESLQFRGISPAGKVLYDLLDAFWLLDLGVAFAAEPVSRPLDPEFPPPALFFSDR